MIADWEANGVYLAAMLWNRHPDLFTRIWQTLLDHRIEVRLLDNVRDIWAKDFCPVQVGPGEFAKFRYEPDYLKDSPELRTSDKVVKSFRDLGRCHRSKIILDGGNIVSSKTRVILTDKVYKENPGWSRADLRTKLQHLLLVEQLIVIPKEPHDPIGHTDAMVRFIDEQTVLVNDYSRVNPVFGERLFKVLRRHNLAIETIPYFHELRSRDGIPSAVGSYSNFLQTEKVVLAPIYKKETDQVAIKKLRSVFGEVPVVPLDCTDLAREGGVLNCISATYRIFPKVS